MCTAAAGKVSVLATALTQATKCTPGNVDEGPAWTYAHMQLELVHVSSITTVHEHWSHTFMSTRQK